MNIRTTCLLLALSAACVATAQLKVEKELELKEGDISAYRLNSQQPIVVDGDTIPFALVKVGLAEPNVDFDSRWVLKQEFIDNEYWVYFMEGVRSVTVKSRRFAPLHYRFPAPLEARSTYTMTIVRPDGEKYKGTIVIQSNVADAEVYVDGVKASDGTPFTYVGDAGMHQIELRAPGYDTQTRMLEAPMSQERTAVINLFKEGSLSVDGIGYGMVDVPAATFRMGDAAMYYASPERQVSLRPFTAGSYPVSAELWEKVMGYPAQGDARGRVTGVSYNQVLDFLAALNRTTGREFRLPTEAEWEYLATNAAKLGIEDIGNAMEWCADWFGRYSLSDTANPTGPESGILRVVRGGTEYTDPDPLYADPHFRWRKHPDMSSAAITFRIVED